MHIVTPVSFALFAAALAAQPSQICQADFNTPNYLNTVSMGGPNLMLAIRLTAPANYTASRAEIFTGNQHGLNTVAIWSHDLALNRPLAQLGAGSWQMSWIRGWQGANLTPPVPLTMGQVFWLVWSPQNSSQASVEANGAGAQQYVSSFNGGAGWGGPYQDHQWKLRIFCGGPPGHYETFGGLGCFGSVRNLPELGWDGVPTTGSSFDVKLARGLPGGNALFTLGDSNTTWNGNSLPLSLTGLGAPFCNILASVAAWLFVAIDASGNAAVTIAVPAAPNLIGFTLYDQWLVLDSAANALGISTSNGGCGIVGT